MSYNWNNVYNYDMVFRQLMEFNPSRSWAVTYTQMWNLSMTTPIATSHGNKRHGGNYYNSYNSSEGGFGSAKPMKRKNDYCWSFNRGNKCKFGKKCKFIECCSYCDSPHHGLVQCEKLDKKDKDNAIAGLNKKSRNSK